MEATSAPSPVNTNPRVANAIVGAAPNIPAKLRGRKTFSKHREDRDNGPADEEANQVLHIT